MQENWKLKCSYLQDQVQQLKLELKDFETVIRLNKDALKMCQEDAYPKQGNATHIILQHVQQENEILYRQIEAMRRERDQAIDRALINEQINEGLEFQEKFNFDQLQEQNMKLRKLLKEKEEQLLGLQNNLNHGALIYIDKHVAAPMEGNLKWSAQVQMQNQVLMKYYNQIQELMEQKDEIVQLNFTLSNEVLKLRACQYNSPKARQDSVFCKKLDEYRQLATRKILIGTSRTQCDRRILADDSGEEQEQTSAVFSPIFSPLPAKVRPPNKKQKNKLMNLQVQLDDAEMPRLDLAKAHQIQQYNIHRIQMMAAQKNHENKSVAELDEKLQKLTSELLAVRNKYSSMIVVAQSLELNVAYLKQQLQDALSTNETLIKSQQNYEKKWAKIRNTYHIFKSHYFNTREAPQHSEKVNHSSLEYNSSSRMMHRDDHTMRTATYFDVERVTNQRTQKYDLSLINAPEDFAFPFQTREDETVPFSSDARQTILQLAQDVYRMHAKMLNHRVSRRGNNKRSASLKLSCQI